MNVEDTVRKIQEFILKPKIAILIISIVAVAIRLLPMRFKYLLGYDPYFHLAYIRYALTHGWVNFFTYAFGPRGILIKNIHPLGLWMTPAFVYKLLKIFGVSLYNAFRITPVIFGVLTIIFLYLAILRLYGKKEAFLSALLLAVSFGHVFRSMAGYYRGDNYMLFWYSAALLTMAIGLKSFIEEDRKKVFSLALLFLPGIFAGLSSAFWSAYYPIFVFIWTNTVMLSLGAFIFGRKKQIITAGIVMFSLVLGVIIANEIGASLGYGMAGYSHGLGKTIAKELGLSLSVIKDAFLSAFLEYMIPLGFVVIGILWAFVNAPRRYKLFSIAAIIFAVIGVAFHYREPISHILKMFSSYPILETQRTGIRDLWEAYGISFLITPAFLLGLRKKRVEDFIVLGLATVSIPMLILWTRFLFIGSLAIATMAGIGIVEVWDILKMRTKGIATGVLIALLLMVPAVTAAEGVKMTYNAEPMINFHWVKALTYLGNHSNINDVVLTWWDHGHWVTYYAMRAPVAQGGPSLSIARYYLGLKNEAYLRSLGVDYVIVSLDTIRKFPAVLETAKTTGYAMILLHPTLITNVMVFSAKGFEVMIAPGREEWGVRVRIGNIWGIPRELWVEKGKSIERVKISGNPTLNAYVYVNLNYGYAVLMNEKAFNTPLARLMFTDNYSTNYKLVYSDGGLVKIYKFIHPNVEVMSKNGRVLLRFKNGNGTSLLITGYLDNGTLVYRRWFNVKGRSEFILPENLNGSVVVRYAYLKGREILDRGVFRISDVLNLNVRG